MTISKQHKEWIDGASYVDLLRKWRFGASGDPIFDGASGSYFATIMIKRKKQIGNDACVFASKQVGWGQ